jgi:serine/threonine-protein kinase
MQSGPMDATRAVHVMRGVVAGIRAAHEQGVVHRDLKPENIMLVERDGDPDFVKLLDFGIARLESANNPQSGMQALTVVGQPVGTPEYMSPEQVLGKPVDARTDLYSLGVIFYELLAGACPFDGNIPKLLRQHISAEPPELPSAVASEHPELARIVRILLAKEPKNRFQTAAELAQALDASGRARPSQTAEDAPASESRTLASLAMRASLAKKRLVGMVEPPARRPSDWRRRALTAAGVALIALAAVLLFVMRDRGEALPSEAPAPSATVRSEPPPTEPPASSADTKSAPAKPRRKSTKSK